MVDSDRCDGCDGWVSNMMAVPNVDGYHGIILETLIGLHPQAMTRVLCCVVLCCFVLSCAGHRKACDNPNSGNHVRAE